MNEEKKHTIAVEMKTEGFEEAGEKIEVIADALDQMPATINLKAKDCEISIHNSIWIDRREENEPQEEPEETPVKTFLVGTSWKQILRNIKGSCSEELCKFCIFKNHDEAGKEYCEITGARPADWKI